MAGPSGSLSPPTSATRADGDGAELLSPSQPSVSNGTATAASPAASRDPRLRRMHQREGSSSGLPGKPPGGAASPLGGQANAANNEHLLAATRASPGRASGCEIRSDDISITQGIPGGSSAGASFLPAKRPSAPQPAEGFHETATNQTSPRLPASPRDTNCVTDEQLHLASDAGDPELARRATVTPSKRGAPDTGSAEMDAMHSTKRARMSTFDGLVEPNGGHLQGSTTARRALDGTTMSSNLSKPNVEPNASPRGRIEPASPVEDRSQAAVMAEQGVLPRQEQQALQFPPTQGWIPASSSVQQAREEPVKRDVSRQARTEAKPTESIEYNSRPLKQTAKDDVLFSVFAQPRRKLPSMLYKIIMSHENKTARARMTENFQSHIERYQTVAFAPRRKAPIANAKIYEELVWELVKSVVDLIDQNDVEAFRVLRRPRWRHGIFLQGRYGADVAVIVAFKGHKPQDKIDEAVNLAGRYPPLPLTNGLVATQCKSGSFTNPNRDIVQSDINAYLNYCTRKSSMEISLGILPWRQYSGLNKDSLRLLQADNVTDESIMNGEIIPDPAKEKNLPTASKAFGSSTLNRAQNDSTESNNRSGTHDIKSSIRSVSPSGAIKETNLAHSKGHQDCAKASNVPSDPSRSELDQTFPNARPSSLVEPPISNSDSPCVTVKRLSSQARSIHEIYWGKLAPDDPVRCSVCCKEGHTRLQCSRLTCGICGAIESHFESACPERVLKSETCGICGADDDTVSNDEDHCPWIWRTSVPCAEVKKHVSVIGNQSTESREELSASGGGSDEDDEGELPDTDPVIMLSTCFRCGDSGHLGGDCMASVSEVSVHANGGHLIKGGRKARDIQNSKTVDAIPQRSYLINPKKPYSTNVRLQEKNSISGGCIDFFTSQWAKAWGVQVYASIARNERRFGIGETSSIPNYNNHQKQLEDLMTTAIIGQGNWQNTRKVFSQVSDVEDEYEPDEAYTSVGY